MNFEKEIRKIEKEGTRDDFEEFQHKGDRFVCAPANY